MYCNVICECDHSDCFSSDVLSDDFHADAALTTDDVKSQILPPKPRYEYFHYIFIDINV